MFTSFLIAAIVLLAFIFQLSTQKKCSARLRVLERDLQHFSDVMCQMAEIQMKAHRKHKANIETLEERIMELSVPSQNANLPLERRHQVLTLVRQGVALEDIVKRLKAPRGEAELIMNLSRYMGAENPPKTNEQVRQYA